MDLAALPRLAAEAYRIAPDWEYEDASACLMYLDGQPVIAFPGTQLTDPGDWFTDAASLIPAPDARLGWCGWGFLDRGRGLYEKLCDDAPFDCVLVGHSLGGALAITIGAMMAADGRAPARIETYGAPRVGGERLAKLLYRIPGNRWRRGNDPVPDVPPEWEHDRPLRQIGVPQDNPLACHSMIGYAADVKAALEG